MTPEPNPSPDQLPTPMSPGGAPPPQGWLKNLLKQRFLLIAGIILLFLAILFIHGYFRKGKGPGEAPLPSPTEARKVGAAPQAGAETAKEVPAKPGATAVQPYAAAPAPAETAKPGGTAVQPHAAAPTSAEAAKPPKASAPSAQEQAPAPLHPAPPPVAPKEAFKGGHFTHALVKIMDDQVNQRLFGWRPNTIIFGKMGLTDNVNNLQIGVLEVARRTILVLNENMTRFAVTEAYNPRVNEAMNFLMVSPDKYWFPSASGKYREAMADLNMYVEDLRLGRARFYSRVDNLIVLLSNYKDILGSCLHNLLKDTEADGSPVSYFKSDDYFYFSQGVAIGMHDMLEAVQEDFGQELQRKNTHKLMEDAIHALHAASQLSPWLVTNGAKGGILANHRANMSTYIGEAEHVVAIMQTVLATN